MLLKLLGAYLAVINGFAFILMGVDKKRAIKARWRIAERDLFLLALLGGSIGIWLGMKYFHHKTQHKSFVYGIPFIFFLQIALVLFVIIV